MAARAALLLLLCAACLALPAHRDAFDGQDTDELGPMTTVPDDFLATLEDVEKNDPELDKRLYTETEDPKTTRNIVLTKQPCGKKQCPHPVLIYEFHLFEDKPIKLPLITASP